MDSDGCCEGVIEVREMAPVVVVGGVNTDMVVQTPHLPRAGETVGGGGVPHHAGAGKGPIRPSLPRDSAQRCGSSGK